MTITRVGTNSKYANGWQSAFGKGASAAKKEAAKPAGRKPETDRKGFGEIGKKPAKKKE